ncbi:DUF4238 domain-containing protein [Parvularcula dongshanensis]|uniref:DUF4238 domain-containing protein n=1 Tax=Parvularcula dongshanensis TaxID=1173995 RepID=A0A840I435_9PROT|nr:DUF4238 domain-containing protein [Parvularcula dongshanensis]MBB4659041.1 hypothetical protein [Parvularcula dongshanensis]
MTQDSNKVTNTVPRRHHYVWRYYLEAWAVDGAVSVVRDQDVFATNPINLAVQKDFYRLSEMSSGDRQIIEEFIARTESEPHMRQLYMRFLDQFFMPSLFKKYFAEWGIEDLDAEKFIENMEIALEETYHSLIESDNIPHLDALRSGNLQFWNDDASATKFVSFLCHQHLRTKRIRDSVVEQFRQHSDPTFAVRLLPIMRAILSQKFARSICAERDLWDIRIITTNTDEVFITSDQPTRNLLSGEGHDHLCLFYPISPKSALLLEKVTNQRIFDNRTLLSCEEVMELNIDTLKHSHEQAFANSQEYLKSILDRAQKSHA